MSTPMPRLLSLVTAVPDQILRQSDVKRAAREMFCPDVGYFDRLQTVFDNAAIDSRHSCVPLEWYLEPHDFAERNRLYIKHALALLTEAATEALAAAGLEATDVDTVVTVSSTGIATPTLDAMLLGRLPFRADVTRLPIFGLGCAGGVLGLARAASLARAAPGARILFLVVELCGLTFRRHDHSKSNIVATALFGDGAAGGVISTEGDGLAIRAWGEHTWPDTLDVMGWDVGGDGLAVIFSRDIPMIVRKQYGEALARFLDRAGLTLGDIDSFVAHPGGAKVLDALEAVFGLPAGGLTASREVLRRCGNMSAATVLFVLEEVLRGRSKKSSGRRHLMSSLGPGFSAGFAVLEDTTA